MGHARIGRIRLKDGGAEVRLIASQSEKEWRDNAAAGLAAFARRVVEFVPENGQITGFIGLGWYEDGSTIAHFHWGDNAPCNRAFLPEFVAECVRRDVITESEARMVFNEMFERG